MKSRIDYLFIDPPPKSELFSNSPWEMMEGHLPSLGIAIMAAILERHGYSVVIWDGMARRSSLKQIADVVKDVRPRFVGLTAMTHSITPAALIAKAIKDSSAEIITMIGGSHVTAVPQETLKKFPGVFDFCVIGEGEETLIELIEAVDNDLNLSLVKGIAYMEGDNNYVQTISRDSIMDMDKLPFPAWHLLPDIKSNYSPTLTSSGGRTTNHLITSRGCPAKCIFCDTSVNGKKIRGYSSDYVIEMIEILHKKYGIDDIQINDDTYVNLKKRVFEISEKLIQKKWDLTWSCDARVSSVSKESLEIMGRSGCWQIAFGVETGSERIMKVLEKRVTFKQVRNAFKWARDAGIGPKGFFIMGNPGETHESIGETISLIRELDMDVMGCTYFTVFPGSPIHSNVEMYGSYDPDWEKTNTYEIGNFIPYGFTSEELISYHRKALRYFYFRPKFVIQQLVKIKSPKHIAYLFGAFIRIIKKTILPNVKVKDTPAHMKP